MKIITQRITIAKECGWGDPDQTLNADTPPGWDHSRDRIPDYHNSLQAMHWAEETLTRAQWVEYCQHLTKGTGIGVSYATVRAAAHATSEQRAEAFLRTIGKWEGAE